MLHLTLDEKLNVTDINESTADGEYGR